MLKYTPSNTKATCLCAIIGFLAILASLSTAAVWMQLTSVWAAKTRTLGFAIDETAFAALFLAAAIALALRWRSGWWVGLLTVGFSTALRFVDVVGMVTEENRMPLVLLMHLSIAMLSMSVLILFFNGTVRAAVGISDQSMRAGSDDETAEPFVRLLPVLQPVLAEAMTRLLNN